MFIGRAKEEYERRICCPVAGYQCKRWSFKDPGLLNANTPATVCCASHATVGWLVLEDKNHSQYGIIIIPYRFCMTFKFMVDNFLCLLLGHCSGAELSQPFRQCGGAGSLPLLQLLGLTPGWKQYRSHFQQFASLYPVPSVFTNYTQVLYWWSRCRWQDG